MDWLNLLAVQGTLKSLLQQHSSKVSILQCSAFFMVQLSHPYTTTGKTIALTRQIFVGKVMSLLYIRLSRLVKAFLPRSKRHLISWLQSPYAAMILVTYQKKKKKSSGNRNLLTNGKKVSFGKKIIFISLGQPKVLKILYQSR